MTTYNLKEFLRGLFDPPQADGPEGITPADLPPEWHFAWDERAAIMEVDGRLPREHAEAAALADILIRMRQAGALPRNDTCV
jgi:hypothetical protein